MGLLSAKSAFLNEILLTKEFILLRQARNNLSANRTLYDEVMNLSQNKSSESSNEFNEEDLSALMHHPEAADYIIACMNMEKLVLSIINDINSAIHLNLR